MKKIGIIFLVLISMIRCKNSTRDKDTTTNSCVDYAIGQNMVDDVFKMVHQAANSSKGIAMVNLLDSTSIFGCDTLIVDTLSNPKSIIIRFNANCTSNSIARSGEIMVTFSTKYDVAGCNVNITFNNYTQGSYTISSGSISYIYNGLVNSLPNYSFNVTQFTITDANLKSIRWSGNQLITITSGTPTATFLDDSYTISGIANGSTFQGNTFNATLTTDLTLAGNCNWVATGAVNVSPENKDVRKLTFGSGCDNKANVSLYDINYEITF